MQKPVEILTEVAKARADAGAAANAIEEPVMLDATAAAHLKGIICFLSAKTKSGGYATLQEHRQGRKLADPTAGELRCVFVIESTVALVSCISPLLLCTTCTQFLIIQVATDDRREQHARTDRHH